MILLPRLRERLGTLVMSPWARQADLETRTRNILLNSLTLLGIGACAIMAVMNGLAGTWVNFLSNALFITFLLTNRIVLDRTRRQQSAALAAVIFLILAASLFGLLGEEPQGGNLLWLFITPPAAIYFLGHRQGILLALAALVLLVLLHIWRGDFGGGYILRTALVYLLILGVTAVFSVLEHRLLQLLSREAHRAGMADHARNTLHNIGNILNSVNTAAGLAESRLRKPLEEKLDRANELLAALAAGKEGTGDELSSLADYYGGLAEALREERAETLAQLARLRRKTALIAEILQEQREEASTREERVPYSCQQLVQEVLEMRRNSLEREGVRVEQEMRCNRPVPLNPVKVIHILVNLVDNAIQAMADTPREERLLTISLLEEGDRAVLKVADRGRGIPAAELEAVFRHGFTTRPGGQGFGLHSCANSMAEMGGSIRAESGGPGRGAAFLLRFPLE